MIRRPPRSTRTDTLFPYTTLFRSAVISGDGLFAAFVSSATNLVSTTVNKAQNHVFLRDLSARSEEHTSELQSLMRISYAVFCLKKKKNTIQMINTAEIRHNNQLHKDTVVHLHSVTTHIQYVH